MVEQGIADGTRYRQALLAIRVGGMLGSKAALSLKVLRRCWLFDAVVAQG